MDFSFCQDKFFARKPCTADDLNVKTVNQETDNNKQLYAKMCLRLASRLQECVNNEGRQFY